LGTERVLYIGEIIFSSKVYFTKLLPKQEVNKPRYQYRAEDRFEYFEFYSEGPKGIIKKVVEYQETGNEKHL
jgi:hypothetical protein